jgi:hypothetical protein
MDLTRNGNGTTDQERAESNILKTGKTYQSPESWANGNLGPSNDPQIEGYLAFLTRELIFSDDPADLRRYLSAHVAYAKFRRSGMQETRFQAWQAIVNACRLSAKYRHSDTKAPSSNAPVIDPEKPDSAERGESWR